MNKQNTEKLLKRFKWLYRDFYKPMNQTCMCWGFECGDGWFDLLWDLSLNIEKRLRPSFIQRKWPLLCDKLYYFIHELAYKTKIHWLSRLSHPFMLPMRADQVKEKFGTLSYYTSGCDDEVYGIISQAERVSGETCETCGQPGRVLGRGWIYTACRTHTKESDLDLWNAPVDQ